MPKDFCDEVLGFLVLGRSCFEQRGLGDPARRAFGSHESVLGPPCLLDRVPCSGKRAVLRWCSVLKAGSDVRSDVGASGFNFLRVFAELHGEIGYSFEQRKGECR